MRKHIKVIVFLVLFTYNKCYSQSCDCITNFNFLARAIKENYIGYDSRIRKAGTKKFNRFTDSLQNAAKHANVVSCYLILKKWMSFFEDGHTDIDLNEELLTPDEIRALFKDTRRVPYDTIELKQYLSQKNIDPIEGLWREDLTGRVYGIRRKSNNSNSFECVVIASDSIFWVPGQLKGVMQKKKNSRTYSALIYSRDHLPGTKEITPRNGIISFPKTAVWRRIFPAKEIPAQNIVQYEPSVNILDSSTVSVTIPSFHLYYKPLVDSLLKANARFIQQSTHLIIDIRNNSGGNIYTYALLLPYLYTNPVKTIGGTILATEDNINKYRLTAADSTRSAEYREETNADIKRMEAHKGQKYLLWPDRIQQPDTL
jgi:hypothetical protein